MNINRTQKIVYAGIPIFLFVILFLGWLSSKKVNKVVTDNFNLQQLVLARNAAGLIKSEVDSLKNKINELSIMISNDKSIPSLEKILKTLYIGIKDKGAVYIKYIDAEKMYLYFYDESGFKKIKATSADIDFYRKLAGTKKNDGEVCITEIFKEEYEGTKMPFFNILKFIKKTHNPNPSSKATITGIIVLKINAYLLTSKITKGIISGNTGYAYIIDQNNIFIYHYEKDFIGRDSIEVRKEKGPGIPFEKIDKIQKNYMLKGYEGTDWYISGWHRGESGHIKKLIAYTPILLSNESNNLWSLAVVAPVTEVEGSVEAIQVEQFIIQLTVILGTMILGLFYIFILVNWSTELQEEVDKKTQDLRLSEERYKSLVENAEDIIFTIDPSGRYLSMNKYGRKFFNKTREEIIGSPIDNIIPSPFADILLTQLKDILIDKESVRFTHFIKIAENEYWLNTIMRRLYDETGNIYAVLGISRDITVIKRKEKIEEQMYQTEKLASMGTLAAGVAHEINNPLAIILGYADLLLEITPPDSQQYSMLKTIEKHANNAKRVVEGLLSFARYSEQKIETCNINENIESVLSVVKNSLKLYNIEIKKDLQGDLPQVQGDPGKLQQVFLNIIINAIHAMKGGGTLTITTRSIDNENIEIRFSDTGLGIAPEHRNRIFDPLFTTKKVGEGTGLGLSVSYGIITQHGGRITFETKTKEESPNPGTTFIITLPISNQKKLEVQ